MRFTPRDDKFFEMFASASENLVNATTLFRTFLNDIPQRKELAAQLADLEHVGDELTSALVKRLNTSFVTPFDREDIYSLAVSLDDVADLIDAGSDHIVLYGLGELPEGVHKQVAILCDLAVLTHEAMSGLKKVGDLEPFWTQTKKAESEADRIHRRLLAELFSGQYEALEVMKLKEVVDDLEDAVNAFERIAKTVEAIAVKES